MFVDKGDSKNNKIQQLIKKLNFHFFLTHFIVNKEKFVCHQIKQRPENNIFENFKPNFFCQLTKILIFFLPQIKDRPENKFFENYFC